jgi:hypothetical protein
VICEGPAQSDEWYTPPEIFQALRLTFDLDPCSAGEGRDHVPVGQRFTKADDGLSQPWHGLVWMNPPFGGRNGQVPWLRKFFQHHSGIALVAARTSSEWFHEFAPKAEAMLFPKGKTKFLRPDGTPGPSPWSGVVLMAAGMPAYVALRDSGLGLFVQRVRP